MRGVLKGRKKLALQNDSQLVKRLTVAPRIREKVFLFKVPGFTVFHANEGLGKSSYQTPLGFTSI